MDRDKNFSVIILYNKDGKILLEHRSKNRKRNPGIWALFGGHVEKGEDPKEAVFREVREELGYKLSNTTLLYVQAVGDSRKNVFVELFDETQKLILDPEESQSYGWFALEDTKGKGYSHDVEVFEKVGEYINQQLNIKK